MALDSARTNNNDSHYRPGGATARGRPLPTPVHAGNGPARLAPREDIMTWSTPTFEVVELGMEVGAYAGNA